MDAAAARELREARPAPAVRTRRARRACAWGAAGRGTIELTAWATFPILRGVMSLPRTLVLSTALGFAGGCSLNPPDVGGHPIVCNATADCQPGEACDTTVSPHVCVAGPDGGAPLGPCVIGGVTYDAGAFEPGQGCQVCDPATPGAWSSFTGVPAAGTCAQGDEVCNAGACAAGCIVGGAFIAAGHSGSNACQLCDPSVSRTQLQPLTFVPDGGCAAGEVCSAGACTAGCVIDGSFESPGAANAASNGCQSCDPTSGVTAWTNASDGTTCTSANGHYCQAGVCANVCNIGGQIENNGAIDPDNGCLACETANDVGNWSPISGAVACGTSGGNYCVAGSCAPACNIGGSVGVVASGSLDATNPCESCLPGTSATSYSAVPDGTACNTGGGTFCSSGVCTSECKINGGLVAAGAPNSSNPDQCCVPATNSTGWTAGFAVESQTVATGTSPQGLAVGDLNGDGKADLVAANLLSVSVSVSYGNGDGTFQSPVTFGTGNGPNSVALADFNGDSLLDMAVANSGDGTVSVLLNQGDGGFADGGVYPVGDTPWAVATGHFQSKTSQDLVVADDGAAGTTPELRVLFNSMSSGKGFLTQANLPLGASAITPLSLAVADFDLDGFDDLVGTNADGTVAVFQNGGNGSFSSPTVLAAAGGATAPVAVVAKDLHGAGIPDVAVACSGTGDVRVFINRAGSWSTMQGPYAVGTTPKAIAAGKFNGGSLSDLAIANDGSGTVSVLINQTATASQSSAFAPQYTYSLTAGLVSIATGEFNGDSLPDLAVVDNTQKTISVLLGQCP